MDGVTGVIKSADGAGGRRSREGRLMVFRKIDKAGELAKLPAKKME